MWKGKQDQMEEVIPITGSNQDSDAESEFVPDPNFDINMINMRIQENMKHFDS